MAIQRGTRVRLTKTNRSDYDGKAQSSFGVGHSAKLHIYFANRGRFVAAMTSNSLPVYWSFRIVTSTPSWSILPVEKMVRREAFKQH